MRWDFFFRTQSNDPSKNRTAACNYILLDLPAGTDLRGAVAEVLKLGAPRGDYHSGLVEVQNETGAWVADDGNRIWTRAPKTADGIKLRALTFTSWDAMDAADSEAA